MIPLTRSALQAVADLDLTEGLNPADHLWATRPGGGDVVRRSRPDRQHDVRALVTPLHRQGRCPLHEASHHPAHLPRADELAGLSLEERQFLMRHESIRTTVDVYGHTDVAVIEAKLEGFTWRRWGEVSDGRRRPTVGSLRRHRHHPGRRSLGWVAAAPIST